MGIGKFFTGIASTSRASFAILNRSGHLEREQIKVLKAIGKHQPVTNRQLMEITRLERGNVCRCLFNAVNADQPKAKIAFKDRCKTTNRIVYYYSLIDWQPKNGGLK